MVSSEDCKTAMFEDSCNHIQHHLFINEFKSVLLFINLFLKCQHQPGLGQGEGGSWEFSFGLMLGMLGAPLCELHCFPRIDTIRKLEFRSQSRKLKPDTLKLDVDVLTISLNVCRHDVLAFKNFFFQLLICASKTALVILSHHLGNKCRSDRGSMQELLHLLNASC